MNKTAKSSPPHTLEAIFERSGDNIEVQWCDKSANGKIWDSYAIPLKELKQKSQEIRKALANLEDSDWDNPSGATIVPRLRALARAGTALYRSLLQGDPDDRQSKVTASKYRQWFEDNVVADPESWHIQVIHQQYDAPIVPWGLVFTPLEEGRHIDDLTDSFEDYRNFWAISFKLACRGIMREDAEQLEAKLDDATSKIALTVEAGDDVIEYYKEDLPVAKKLFFNDFVSRSLGAFEDLSKRHKKFNLFWYFFLNADDNAYVIDGKELGDSEIAKAQERLKEVLILFLDGDAVISSDRGARWLDAVLQLGRSGLIATETDIKNPQLRYVGWAFMKIILSSKKKPLIAAIADARAELWPKSLFYGVYCDPLHIFFDPPPKENIQDADVFLKRVHKFLDTSGND